MSSVSPGKGPQFSQGVRSQEALPSNKSWKGASIALGAGSAVTGAVALTAIVATVLIRQA